MQSSETAALSRFGFTLIELLIVIAIILILIAIALPNFLEAQLRAKVARVSNDLKTMSTALESYFIDWQTYPDDSEDEFAPGLWGLAQLTTPLFYLKELPYDAFRGTANRADDNAVYFEMGSTGLSPGELALGLTTNPFNIHAYALYSSGPDGIDEFEGERRWPFHGPGPVCPGNVNDMGSITYSPTNGTISVGNIHAFGGEWRSGHWCLDFVEIFGKGADFVAVR